MGVIEASSSLLDYPESNGNGGDSPSVITF